MHKQNSALLFLIGLGSITQIHVVGSIGISEIPIFLLAPIVFIKNYRLLAHDGFLPILWLAIFATIGCFIGGALNSCPTIFLLKGMAMIYSVFAVMTVLHGLLRNNLNGLRWLLLGIFISSIISVFIFQQETFIVRGGEALQGEEAVVAVMSYALFWSHKAADILRLPTRCAYMQTPVIYSVFAQVIVAGVYLMYSKSSGRAAAVTALMAALFICLGGKSRARMRKMGAHIVLIFLIMCVGLLGAKSLYSFLAKSGAIGDVAKAKYEHQTRMGTSALNMLMAGRIEFFVSLRAACDRPILGFGPKAVDTNGYLASYLKKYGAPADYANHMERMRYLASRGVSEILIPNHSIIAGSWLNCGIFGLLLCLYILYRFYRFFRHDASAIPQWYGYLAIALSVSLWDMFFSGIDRINFPTMLTAIMLVSAVKQGRVVLPYEMEMEARKWE